MTFPAQLLTDIRTVLSTGYLPDTCTNGRTNATLACFVESEPKLLMIERGFRVRSYTVTLPYGSDVVAGDVLTLDTGSAFAVQQTLTPLSDQVTLRLVCVPTSLALASYMATESATFRHPTTPGQTVAAAISVIDQLEDVKITDLMPGYRWMVLFENTLRYPNGGQVGANHHLLLASLFGSESGGAARYGIISQPRPVLHGLPFMACFVKEKAS